MYGIGAKSLGEQLGVGENEAFKFMENFKVFLTFFLFAVLSLNTNVEQSHLNSLLLAIRNTYI